MLTPSAGTPPPPPPFSLSSPLPTSFLPSLSPLPHRRRRRCLPVPKAGAFPPRRAAAPLSSNNLPAPEQTPPPTTSTSAPASPARPSTAFAAGGYRAAGPSEDPLVSKLRTQLGVIHPLPAPPPLSSLPRSVLGLFALFFFVGAAFDKLLTLRRRRRAEREVRVNGSWPQVPTSGFSLFLEEKDLQRKESVEWVNMVLGKLWKVYRPGIEGWIVGLLQPVIDNLQKPDYVNRVEIRQFHLGEEPLSVRNVERRTSRRANDLQYQIGIRYAGDARMALALSLKFSAVPIVVPVWVRDFDIDGELWVKLRLIPTEPWVGAVSWAFVSLPKIKFELSLFRLFNLMAIPVLSIFLTKLLTEDLPRLFVRPKKIVLDFEKGRAMGPVAGDVASDIIQNVASGIMQGVASDLVQDVQDGNKDFVGELSVTLVDARKLSFVLFGKTDPYVAMILGDQVIKSKKNSQTTVTGLPEEPIWNQDFHMLVVNPRKQKLCIEVKDTVGFTDITIGTGEVDLSSLKDTVPCSTPRKADSVDRLSSQVVAAMESTKVSALLVLAMLVLSSPTVVLACSPASGCGSGTPSSGTPSGGGISISPVIGVVGGTVTPVIGVVGGTVTPVIGGAAPTAGGVVGKVTPAVGGMVPAVGGVAGKVGGMVAPVVGTVGGVAGKVTPAVGGMAPAVGGVVGTVGGMVAPVVGTVGGVAGKVPAAGGVVSPVVGIIGPIIGIGGSPASPSPKRHGGRKACPPSPPTPTPSPPTPTPAPTPPTPTPSSDTCPIDTLKLGVCLDLLGNELHIGDASVKCCPLVQGIAGLTAAACLCTAIKAKVLNLALYVPLALQLLVNDCGCAVPPGYTCA